MIPSEYIDELYIAKN